MSSYKFFEQKGNQIECVKLNGAIEIAPKLGISQMIVDLVSTGKTLKENKNYLAGLNVFKGVITCKGVADSFKMKYTSPDRALQN